MSDLRLRRSITAICNDYKDGMSETDKNKKKEKQKQLTDLIRAWKGIYDISEKTPDAWNSFFKIGGFHGEPFRGAGFGKSDWWGGYCNHGNVLFPTWHRAYCLRIEDALRSIPDCGDVTLPYWDELGEEGVPDIFHQKKFKLDGKTIPNPLYSYKLPINIVDHVDQTNPPGKNLYGKEKGYETKRFPKSGLVGTKERKKDSDEWNKQFEDEAEAAKILNRNVKIWLDLGDPTDPESGGTRWKFENCLRAPNYTVFSNGTSAAAWNDNAFPKDQVTSLEQPHDDIHLAVGGFNIPGLKDYDRDYSGANGDMGENDTAGLDPIFYFHHAQIDRYFWCWQQLKSSTDKLNIIEDYPGTNSVDHQGPTPGVAGGTWLNLDSELRPFKKRIRFSEHVAHNLTSDDHIAMDSQLGYLTSRDVINIESQLGYTYQDLPEEPEMGETSKRSVRISGVNKNHIAGSCQLVVTVDDQVVAVESVLSRWHVRGCANCQLSADRHVYVPLPGIANASSKVKAFVATKERTKDKPFAFEANTEVIEEDETYLLRSFNAHLNV